VAPPIGVAAAMDLRPHRQRVVPATLGRDPGGPSDCKGRH